MVKFKQTAIIIPSYNEDKNLLILARKIKKVSPLFKIIVVDDSNRKQYLKLKKLLKNFKNLSIISRGEKLGRGSAVMMGLKKAFADKNIEYFFEMDADLAHRPEELSQFYPRGQDCDMVVGSRYIKGSNIIKWPLYRLVQSRVINWLLNLWLGLSLSDYTNGFRLYHRAAVEFLLKQQLKHSGYIALSEIAYKLKKNGFKIGEVAISFTDRRYGKSNANAAELLRSLKGAFLIRFSS